MAGKLIADLSLDLDNEWSYLKTHGDEVWNTFPTYLPKVIPLFLEILETHRLKITVFVVGQDAVIEANQPVLKTISAIGHEIGNHSFKHEPWLHRYTRDQLEAEFDTAEQAIGLVTDQKLTGFRGPGFSFSDDVLEILVQRGYLYDGSTLPTFIGPLARAITSSNPICRTPKPKTVNSYSVQSAMVCEAFDLTSGRLIKDQY